MSSLTSSDDDDLVDVAEPPPRPTAASLARAASFWQRASSIYLSYKVTQVTAATVRVAGGMSEDAAKERLWLPQHERAGKAMFDLASSLSGFYLKVGQFLNVREDFVALPVCKALRPLQESVRPMAAAEVRATLEDAFCGGPGSRFSSLEDIFESIDLEKPLGSASVAQVHAAVLKPELYRFFEDEDAEDDDGDAFPERGRRRTWKKKKLAVLPSDDRRVAVKVQRRGVLGCFLEDLAQIRLAAAFLSQRETNFDLVSAVDELSSQIRGEFDFEREARVMNRIGRGLRNANSPIAVPRSVPGLVSRTALVMERLPGVPLTRLAGDDVEIPFDVKVVSSSPSSSDEKEEEEEAKRLKKSKLAAPPVGIRKLLASRVLDAVTDAYGIMLFELGLLQCDPHPGNIMVDTESSLLPKVGLIDYGQSKQVTRGEQESLARLFVAMAQAGDAPLSEFCSALDAAQSDEVAAAFKALGIVTEVTPLGLASGLTERDLILNTAVRLLDTRGRVQPFAANSTLRQLATRKLPPELFFVVRSVQLLRGLAAAAGVEMSVATRWESMAKGVLAGKAARERGEGGEDGDEDRGGRRDPWGRPFVWAGGVVPGGVAADDERWARSLLKKGKKRNRLASALLFPRRRGLWALWAAALLSSAAGVAAAAVAAASLSAAAAAMATASAAATAAAAAAAAALAPTLALWVASLALQASWPVLLLVARRPGAALAHGAAALSALAAAAAAAASVAATAAAAAPGAGAAGKVAVSSSAFSSPNIAPLLMVPSMLAMLCGLFVNAALLVAARRRRRSKREREERGGDNLPLSPASASAPPSSPSSVSAFRAAPAIFGAASPFVGASSSSLGGARMHQRLPTMPPPALLPR